MIELAGNRPDPARVCIDQALALARDGGMKFFGPTVLALAARLANEPTERVALLDEGEKVLNEGCVSHNYFLFYRDGIEAALEIRDWRRAENYCDALERYTSAEPLPWSDLFVKRGRALARFGRGERSTQLVTEMRGIEAVLQEVGLALHLPAIASALATM
jgi:hypothetical protein